MFKGMSSRRLRLVVTGGALVAAIAAPAAVKADTGGIVPAIGPMVSRDETISITSVGLTGKLVVNVGISFVCQPFDVIDWETGQTVRSTAGSIEDVSVVVLRAQGKTIDYGVAGAGGGVAVCDGTTVNTMTVPVTAAVSPWKSGAAVVGASVYVAEPTQFQDSDFASSGPVVARLGH